MVSYDAMQPALEGAEPTTFVAPVPKRKPGQSRMKVVCLTCGKPGVFAPVGPNRVPAWICTDYSSSCDSYVGCEKGTENALGSLAGPALRAARIKAHGWIDRLWRGAHAVGSRKEVYQALSQSMAMKNFHVGRADIQVLERLEARRESIQRAFDRVPIAASSPGEISEQLDLLLVNAIFGSNTRRLWPSDPGGQVAAERCLFLGFATTTLDAAGRRWITKDFPPRSLPGKTIAK